MALDRDKSGCIRESTSMPSARHDEANRRQATSGPCPTFPAGSEASMAHAPSCGWTTREVRDEGRDEAIRRRLEEWGRELRPLGAFEAWLAERVVAESLRI